VTPARWATIRLSRCLFATLLVGCAGSGPRAPWPGPNEGFTPGHAEVKTLTPGYKRAGAKALVREIARPTLANLDYAAYDANFLIADPPPEGGAGKDGPTAVATPFAGALESLTGSIRQTTLSPTERTLPLALAPAAAWLASRSPKLASGLEELIANVREEAWGQAASPLARQQAVLGYLHQAGGKTELWVKVEFQPWWSGFSHLPDEDGDGVPEVYGRARDGLLSAEAMTILATEYAGATLDAAGVASWAHKLASYWYPSYNTDLVAPGPRWPDDETEADVRGSLGGASFAAPAVVMRGKPEGKPVYNVFLVKGIGDAATAAAKMPTRRLPKGKPSPKPEMVATAIASELSTEGKGSWRAWAKEAADFHAGLKQQLKARPAAIKALPGEDGFLFYRNGFDYIAGGDLEKQKRGKNPLPVIVEWQRMLRANGVDFLFVPVPDKAEIFPDKVAGASGDALDGKIVNPYARKLLVDLAAAGVETVDLWRPFLEDRKRDRNAAEPLFQKQDTHWTPRGMSVAAAAIAARIKQYPWYAELAPQSKRYREKPASFQRYGDLHARLKEGEKRQLQPESLTAAQVVGPDGALYVDDPDSPVVVLGDSFTGVLELTDCEHAGLSAHIAKGIGAPVDLVMSYGGGPNVRHKLMRRGVEALAGKRLVVWVMTARDLYDYWEDWEPLAGK
jgi:alginate O-acetyltransferase complex protein AlgJ